jgi:hypothetical protein
MISARSSGRRFASAPRRASAHEGAASRGENLVRQTAKFLIDKQPRIHLSGMPAHRRRESPYGTGLPASSEGVASPQAGLTALG